MIVVECNNLEAEMARNKISKKDLADCCGCSLRTLYSRFTGETQWLYEECVAIRDKFFPEMELNYLFPYKQAS